MGKNFKVPIKHDSQLIRISDTAFPVSGYTR